MDNVFQNYNAFYNMILSTTIMSNSTTPEFEEDSKKIIDFIGKSFHLSNSLITECKKIVFNKLSTIGLITDRNAVYGNREYGLEYSDDELLYDIKGNVLVKLQNLSDNHDSEFNPCWFDYSHYKTYQPFVRFFEINTTSANGNLITTRQIGILEALGIGCERNLDIAIKRFTQCAFWGDIPSMYYLAYTYSLAKNKEKEKVFLELATLADKYLNAGCTVLPQEANDTFSEEARLLYVYISSIKQDIVYAYNKINIDFSFIEAINCDSLDYSQKMDFINNYDKKVWKNVTNSSAMPTAKLGFN